MVIITSFPLNDIEAGKRRYNVADEKHQKRVKVGGQRKRSGGRWLGVASANRGKSPSAQRGELEQQTLTKMVLH